MTVLILLSGIVDYKYRKIPTVFILLLFIWSIFLSRVDSYEKIAGFLVTSIPLLVLSMVTGKLKGGDYKFLVACATALGITVFIKILTLAMLCAIVWSFIKKERSVPLAFVFMGGYFIFLIL